MNIEQLFDTISGQYDRFNHLTSFGIDRLWRWRTVRALRPADTVLDVAVGTADLAIAMLRSGRAAHVEGIDLSHEMMLIGADKARRAGVADRLHMVQGSALDMPYDEGRFDALTCAYGLRNFGDTDRGLSEFYRVLKPGGQLLILEFSHPRNRVLSWLYDLYFHYVMTPIGGLLTHDRAAFEYFYRSVRHFIWGDEMCTHLRAAGFVDVSYRTMTFGISTLYIATK